MSSASPVQRRHLSEAAVELYMSLGAQDRGATDRGAQDRGAQGRSVHDRGTNDRGANGRSVHDRGANGQSATDQENRAAWAELRRAGFVAGELEEPVLLDPAVAVRGIERRLLTEWNALNEEIVLLNRAFESMRAAYDQSEWSATGGGESVQTITGAEAVDAAIEDAFQRCVHEVRTAQVGSGASQRWLDRARHHEQLLERGVQTRMLFQHVARFHVPIRSVVARATELGSQVRTLDEFFEQLTVVDDVVAFLPAGDRRDPAGDRRDDIVAVRHPAVVRFLVDAFDRAWTRGLPFSPVQDTRVVRQAIDGTRLAVMRLVIEGSTDEAGARRVGLSLRNYREHVRALMAQFEVRTRAQLGYRVGMSDLVLLARFVKRPGQETR